jgi:tetratricopeptide (TPR) repeat protein
MKDTTVRTAARTLVPFLLLLASCASPRLNVLTGNYRYSRGEYPQAVIRYFEAVEKERYLAFLAYNLGNAYYALGESLAAVETLEGATPITFFFEPISTSGWSISSKGCTRRRYLNS